MSGGHFLSSWESPSNSRRIRYGCGSHTLPSGMRPWPGHPEYTAERSSLRQWERAGASCFPGPASCQELRSWWSRRTWGGYSGGRPPNGPTWPPAAAGPHRSHPRHCLRSAASRQTLQRSQTGSQCVIVNGRTRSISWMPPAFPLFFTFYGYRFLKM